MEFQLAKRRIQFSFIYNYVTPSSSEDMINLQDISFLPAWVHLNQTRLPNPQNDEAPATRSSI